MSKVTDRGPKGAGVRDPKQAATQGACKCTGDLPVSLGTRFRPGSGCSDGGLAGWFAGQDAAVGEGEGGPACVGVEVDVPVVFVDHVMVSLAEQEQVVELGVTVASPPLDVMRVGPRFVAVAAREPAAAIADRDCFPQPGWDAVVAASVVEDFAGTGPQHAVHHAVAEECVGRPAVEDPPVRGDRTATQPKMLRPIAVTGGVARLAWVFWFGGGCSLVRVR